jgi:hypothetical protein
VWKLERGGQLGLTKRRKINFYPGTLLDAPWTHDDTDPLFVTYFSCSSSYVLYLVPGMLFVVLHLYMLVRGPLSSLQQNLIEINTCSASELHVGRNFSLFVRRD